MNKAAVFCEHQKGPFFEGWYWKHRSGPRVDAFIPGVSVGKDGRRMAFVQYIGPCGTAMARYPAEQFYASPRRLVIRVGENEFSEQGARIRMTGERFDIRADFRYGPFETVRRTAYAPTLMGPFAYLPHMECCHDVLSLSHTVEGTLSWNGRREEYNGSGYLEKDWGRSFPEAWTWLQCSDFPGKNCRFMAAFARVPLPAGSFRGLICVFTIDGEQHRVASYYGARVRAFYSSRTFTYLEFTQGPLRVAVEAEREGAGVLYAPVLGNMERTIEECPACALRLRVWRQGRLVFSGRGKNAGFEQVGRLY